MSEQETSETEHRQSPPPQLDHAVLRGVLCCAGTAVETIIIDAPHLIAITRRRSCPDTASPLCEETTVEFTEENSTSENF